MTDLPLPVLLLGLLFGVQHATDPDHVIAVATIVARTRRFGAGALVGAFWGVGHTITITAVGYLLLFGVGTIGGMTAITGLLSLPFTIRAPRLERWRRGLALLAGAASLGFGLYMVFEIGFVDGLFLDRVAQVLR